MSNAFYFEFEGDYSQIRNLLPRVMGEISLHLVPQRYSLYSGDRFSKFGNFNFEHFAILFGESVKNAYAHGDASEKGLDYLLILGEKGICQAFNDGGIFFKRKDIKDIFEGRKYLREYNESPKVEKISGWGRGVGEGVYKCSDEIFVDSEFGTIFLTQGLERMFLLVKGDTPLITPPSHHLISPFQASTE